MSEGNLIPSATSLVLTSGVVSYFIYKKYEPSNFSSSFLLLLALPGTIASLVHDQFTTTAAAIAAVYAGYWSTLLALVFAYRLSPWHPLAGFPGPVIGRLSKLWMTYKVWRGRPQEYLLELHRKYGDVVRTGPNQVSIRHEDAVTPILKESMKGPYFLTRRNGAVDQIDGLFTVEAYAKRRKGWNRGTSTSSVKGYEELLASVIQDLTTSLEKRQGETVNFAGWMLYAAFDFMGEMALSTQFNSVKTGSDASGIIHALEEGVRELAWMAEIPWFTPYMNFLNKYLVSGGGAWAAFQKIGFEAANSRVARGLGRRDLFHHLMDGDDLEEDKPPIDEVSTDGTLAIIAGSDTSATTLSHVFYFLFRNPECMDRLRAEVESRYPDFTDPSVDMSKQAEMPYLNACIKEALRLLPAVLGPLQRRINTGTGGIMVGPHLIPDGAMAVPYHYAVQRDPRYFYPLPDQFWPDRWLIQDSYKLPSGDVISKKDLVLNRHVYTPFSAGMRNCPGKSIAILELRAILCSLIQKFDIVKDPDYNLDNWEKDIKDVFVTNCGPLMVQLRARY